MNIFKRASQW